MKYVVQSLQKFKKETAIELRKKGFSHSEIQERIKIPKSTLSFWLKKIKLTDYQIQKLKDKRNKIARINSEKRSLNIKRQIEEIKNSSAKEVGQISKRELWLIGIILYWLRRNKNDFKNGVMFTSSNPDLIKLFLKWLKEIGGIKDEEIKFDVFLKKKKIASDELLKKVIRYWSNEIGYPKEKFLHHIYFQRSNYQPNPKNKTNSTTNKANDTNKNSNTNNINNINNNGDNNNKIHGFLRVRVKASSMLARQLAGWIEGIVNLIEP